MADQNPTALITGSSRGIGRACAVKLAAQGMDIVVNYRWNEEAGNETAQLVRDLGRRAIVVCADASTEDGLKQLWDEGEKQLGPIHAAVSNAVGLDLSGGKDVSQMMGPSFTVPKEMWDEMQNVQVGQLRALGGLAAQRMPEGGHLVGLSSLGSRFVLPGYAAVGIAKAGIETLTRYLAVELAGKRINVNALCPGSVDTDALKVIGYYEAAKKAAARTPAGRMATVEDVADIVGFLCSDASRWITGQTIVADGGATLMGGV